MMTTTLSHRSSRVDMAQLSTTNVVARQQKRTPPELGVGLAVILRSFLEHTPAHIRMQQATTSNPFRLFCSEPPITLEAFGERLGTYFSCSPVCFQVAAVYLGRVWGVHPEVFEPLSVFKLMLVSLTVAVKFCDDRCSSQVHYAHCGGIEVNELNTLEALFLNSLLKFEAFVQEAELQIAGLTIEKYCVAVEQSAASARNSTHSAQDWQESESKASMSSIPEDNMMDTTTEATTAAELGTAAPVAPPKSLRRTSHTSF